MDIEMKVACLEKEMAEMRYRVEASMLNDEMLTLVLTKMKEFGVQEFSYGMLRISMPYRPEHLGSSLALNKD